MGFRHKFAYSFFDFSAYKGFLVDGLGKSIFYIFLVTLIFSTITSISEINLINSEISNVENNIIHNSPDFELKNGILSVDSNETIYHKHDGDYLFNFLSSSAIYLNFMDLDNSEASGNQNNFLSNTSSSDSENSIWSANTEKPNYYMIIVDTKGKTNSSILNSYKDSIYIDSSNILLKKNNKTIETIQFDKCSWLAINKDQMLTVLYTLKLFTPISLIIFKPIISLMNTLILGFIIFGPFSLFLGSFMGVKLNYSRACTLSFYAMTLPLLLEALLNVAGVVIPEFAYIFYMVTLLYCGLAINEFRNSDKSNLNFMQ